MNIEMSIIVLLVAAMLGGGQVEAAPPPEAGSPVLAPTEDQVSGPETESILHVRHDGERGVTSISVSADTFPSAASPSTPSPSEGTAARARIVVFRSTKPITKDSLRFCPQVATLTRDNARCEIKVLDSGEAYYTLAVVDEYNRVDKTLLQESLVGPILETCRTPPLSPSPWRRCTAGRLFLCWESAADTNVTKYHVYQRNASGKRLVGSVRQPDISGVISYEIPFSLIAGEDYEFTVTAVNASGLESLDSASIFASLAPDLAVGSGGTIARNKDFSIARTFPQVGKPVKMSVTVHNHGLCSANGVDVAVFARHDASHTSCVLLERSVDLAPDESATLGFTWTPEVLGEHHLTLAVDPRNRIAEIATQNNQATVLVPVVKRDVYIAWYGDPLDVDWCNVPNCRPVDVQEWKRRGATVAFCGMVGNIEEFYRQKIDEGFGGVQVDEIGAYDVGTKKFIGWLTGLKRDHPDFFIALWMAASPTPELACENRIDLYLGENYYTIGTAPALFDVHIEHARRLGICDKYVFGLGAGAEHACRLAHTHSINEQVAFLEQEMKYIAENAPEMPGIALYGSRPEMNKQVDQLCYRYFVQPQFKGDGP